MTQEDKELLLKDLCARLPYGVKVKCEKYPFPVTVLYAGNIDEVKFKETGGIEHIYIIKPYLFPLSSMTEEQKIELTCIIDSDYAQIDWYNKKHFDYRGLIPKSLALDATNLGIYE